GRISPKCAGLWNDEQRDKWKEIVEFSHSLNAPIGIQLGHAGRKASTYPMLPGYARGSVPLEEGGWETIGPSAISYPGYTAPREMSMQDIAATVEHFAAAAKRAVEAGFDTIELHGAHGYLLHNFLSPLSNQRSDSYGGSFENRVRFPLEVVDAVRAVIPQGMPLIMRVSATDWVTDRLAWDVEQTIEFARLLREHGVDFVDVSTGGNEHAEIPVGPEYQVEYATRVREAGLPVSTVGLITEAQHAEQILSDDRADVIEIGRAALKDAYWARHAAEELGEPLEPLPSYSRAK
ncbi:TPA: NADH:flavin oxidoreductase/NADH oxidase, partial [Corynebacterium striatum]|nr:NADH:flavin oxidoreductase/NADH oxidase [Corynebacterium striatum]HAT1321526.1 NADH:flavin oxidoreductase/NADH oxidase [Corynebacterium striatum]HAT1420520.1 NADH:flavin oxidoreductase/NADH oxidase [Corynebacterium striatum]HAT6643750.1 NADH:flavin oxidoreductase/NADH oxidase [Corynebacterium striatum]